MPGEIKLRLRGFVEFLKPEARLDPVEHAPVNDVELHERLAAGAYLVHAGLIFGAPRIREGEPVERVSERLEDSFRFTGDAVSPIHDGAEHIEEQGLDLGQRVRLRPRPWRSEEPRSGDRERRASSQHRAAIERRHYTLPVPSRV